MAVQDGYGKVSGSESLVFAYDLKDTTNSFKGQPATNIFLSGNPNGQGSAVEIIQTNYFLGKVIDSGVVYRSYVINPAQSDTPTYYNNGGINKGSMVFPQLNPNTEYIQISFDYYGITPYRRFCCSGTGLNGYLGVTSTDSTYDTYGWDTTYSPGSGDDWNNDINRMGYWQKISLIVDLRDDKVPSNISAMYIYLDAATQGDGYFANMIFTEHTTYPSGPIRWVSGTRSNTQGLLDLTTNSTVNISGVSFNSSAVMTFDGTNDEIVIPYNSSFNTNTFTVESVCKLTTNDNQHRTVASRNASVYSHSNGWWMGTLRNGLGNGNNDFRFFLWGDSGYITYNTSNGGNDNLYHHMVLSCDGTTGFFYIDGVLVYSETKPSGNLYSSSSDLLMGKSPSGDYWSGDIPQVKLYNRALTSTEVSNNYLKYKRQYGLT